MSRCAGEVNKQGHFRPDVSPQHREARTRALAKYPVAIWRKLQ